MRLTVDGLGIEAAVWGPHATSRLPIVLLHEGLGSVSLWKTFPAKLAHRTGRRVLAYSRFGHGASDPPRRPPTAGFMHDEADRLPRVLKAAGIDRAVVFGHSDGGSIGLIAAAAYPALIHALVLEAPHVFVEDISVASIAERAAAFANPDDDFRERLARHHSRVDVAFHGWSDVWLDPAFREWNLERCLPRISCPSLLIQGRDDCYGTLQQLDAIVRQVRGPTQRLVLGECGHSPHRDQPQHVLSAVARFLATAD